MTWEDDMVRRCIALRQAGRTYDAIAAELGVSRGAVAGCLRRHRENPRVRHPPMKAAHNRGVLPKHTVQSHVVSVAVADLLKKLVIAGTELKQARFGPGERAKTIAFQKAAEALVDRLRPMPKPNTKETVR